MDKIEFKTIQNNLGEEALIFINNKNLIETLKEYELPFAEKEGHPNIAGGYAGLGKDQLYSHLTEPWKKSDIPILTCAGCYEWGCWPMAISLEENNGVVIWKNFRQPHRGPGSKSSFWDFSKFPEFIFEKSAYDKALEILKN